MQRQASTLLGELRGFIDQPDYPTLVINGTDASMILPNRTLASFDRQDDDNYYLLFPQPCADAAAYMDLVAASLTEQLEILNTELAARQLDPLPSLPLPVHDSRYAPAERLQAAAEHLGEFLPGAAPIVWGLLAGEISDPKGYRAMVGPLLAMEKVEPWMDRHRFFLRDQAERPFLVPELLAAKNDRVQVMDIDFSNESWVQGLVETASDKGLPADERMNAFFLLGAVDFGFRRIAEALEKFGVCFSFFNQQGNALMQTLCLTGAADAMRTAGRPKDALKFYQQTLALGVADQNLPVIQQSAYGAGSMSLELSENREAEGYLKHADAAAGKLNNPNAKCDAMEKRGLVAWRLGKVDEAVDIWVKGKDLAKQFFHMERAASILNYLIALSRQSGLQHRVAQFEAERAELGVPAAGEPLGAGAPGEAAPRGAPKA